jgi:hypothetical protein
LPFGSSTGQRIVFDGDDGSILIYDMNDDLIGRIEPVATTMFVEALSSSGAIAGLQASTAAAFLKLRPPDFGANVIVTAQIAADIDSGIGRPYMLLQSPGLNGLDRARVFVIGAESGGTGTEGPRVSIDGGNLIQADLILNSRSMPRGVLASGQYRNTTADSAAVAVGALSDMAVTVAVDSRRRYQFSLNTELTMVAVGTAHYLELYDGTANVGRFVAVPPATNPAGSNVHYVNSVIDYVSATTATKTFTVRNGAGSGGAVVLSRGLPDVTYRSLTVTDVGRLSIAI